MVKGNPMKHTARNLKSRLAEIHIGTVLLVLFLFGLLGASAWWAVYVWTSIDVQMPTAGYVALFAGIIFSLLVGCGLMALVFYSNRKGYDEPPHLVRSGTYPSLAATSEMRRPSAISQWQPLALLRPPYHQCSSDRR
jgi:hypothetical protein